MSQSQFLEAFYIPTSYLVIERSLILQELSRKGYIQMPTNDFDITTLFDFPADIPRIKSASLLNDDSIVVTGHKNGFLALWRIGQKDPIKKFNLRSEIECITISSKNKVLIGCNSGDIYFLDSEEPYEVTLIRKGERDKFSRIWRLKWVDDNSFIATSTFGNVLNFKRSHEGLWNSEQLVAHSNSVFGLDFKEGYLATGDYRGLIVIWKMDDGKFTETGRVRTIGPIEDIKWNTKTSISAVTSSGHVYYMEFDLNKSEWNIVFDAFVALEKGKSIHFTNSGNDIVAIAGDELLHISLSSQQVKKHDLKDGVSIYGISSNRIAVITQRSIVQIEIHDILVPDSLIKYKFAKISLIGHTGVGKSTLCDTIIGAGEYDKQSTYGKKVWEWNLAIGSEDRRILFHDHGGQETVMYTYLPFITDSDILMLLFKKNDVSTFNKIENLIPRIKSFVSEKTKMMLVETWVDQDMDETPKGNVDKLIKEGSIKYCLPVSATNNIGVQELKDALIKEIDWDKARVVIQSKESENTMSLISELQSDQIFTLKFDEVHSMYNERWNHISKVHLDFLLRNFSSEGIIEYYPDASEFIIFGGKNYTELRSKIPIFARGKNGIVKISDMEKEFSTLPYYVKIIDYLFQEYRVHIKNGDLRIFPELLRNGDISPIEKDITFDKNRSFFIEVESSNIRHELLIQALSELNLQCIDLTSNQGMFAWENNAYLYYLFQRSGDPLQGVKTRFTFYLSGEKDKYVQRLKENFKLIIESLYGPAVAQSDFTINDYLKKNEEKDYDIAISYASQQRYYVETVAELLKNKGVKVFYAPFEEIDMWGRDIEKYLYDTYFSKAKTCLMFISKEYKASKWCEIESQMAFARQEKQGLYILPVRFDDTMLPGLNSSLLFLNVASNPPHVLSEKIVTKLEHEGLI